MSSTPQSALSQAKVTALAAPGTLRVAGLALPLIYLLAKLAMLAVLAVNTAYVMDEYWIVDEALLTSNRLYQDVWPSKTLLYGFFYRPAHLLGETSVEVMLVARLQTLVLAVLSLGLLYRVARNIGRPPMQALFLLCVVLAFSSYMERAFNVRPESLALFFATAALVAATSDAARLRRFFVAGLLSGAAFLATQKAVYFNVALGLALVGDALARRSLKAAFLSGGVLLLGWALVLLAYFVFLIYQGADLPRMMGHLFMGPAVENALGGHVVYENLRGFLVQTLHRNLPVYLICGLGWLSLAPRVLSLASGERIAWLFTLVIAGLVYAHPAPWPYNFIMAIPFVALWAPALIDLLVRWRGFERQALVVVFVLALSLSGLRNVTYLGHDNRYQNHVLERAEALLDSDDAYGDGIGMLVTRRQVGSRFPGQVSSWDLPIITGLKAAAERDDVSYFDGIFADGAKVWILSYRTSALAEILEPYFRHSYVPIFPNIAIAGTEVPHRREAIYKNYWTGTYHLYASDGSPSPLSWQLDGERVSGPVYLAAGKHRISLAEAPEQAGYYLLPAGIDLPFDMTADRAPKFLFPHTYNF